MGSTSAGTIRLVCGLGLHGMEAQPVHMHVTYVPYIHSTVQSSRLHQAYHTPFHSPLLAVLPPTRSNNVMYNAGLEIFFYFSNSTEASCSTSSKSPLRKTDD
jgi:hypothetical protein